MIIFDFYLLIRYLSFKDLYLRKTNEMDIGRTPKMISIEISPCRCLHHEEVNVVPCFTQVLQIVIRLIFVIVKFLRHISATV